MSTAPIISLKPRHREIMRRLVQGHLAIDIAKDLAISPRTLSVIIHSPVFQQELRELEVSAEGKALAVQKVLFETAAAGINLHKQIVENNLVGKDGVELDLDVRVRQRSATDALVLATRIMKFSGGVEGGFNGGGGSDVPYERRLREVIVRESYMVGGGQAVVSASLPEDDGEAGLEAILNQEELEAEEGVEFPCVGGGRGGF